MSQLANDLRAARALIAESEHWCQESYARDGQGKAIDDASPNAVAFCALGACWRTIRGTGTEVETDVMDRVRDLTLMLQRAAGEDGIAYYNDHRTHAEVLALFDAAIAAAEGEVHQ